MSGLEGHDPAEHLYRRLVERVAHVHQVSIASVVGSSRLRTAVLARQHAWFELRELGFSWTEIGNAAGRHHTTCIEGAARFARAAGLPDWESER